MAFVPAIFSRLSLLTEQGESCKLPSILALSQRNGTLLKHGPKPFLQRNLLPFSRPTYHRNSKVNPSANQNQMIEIHSGGYFALVAYVPEPLASFLYEMRRHLSDAPCPQPHVTILPPRPLRVPLESACQSARATLQLQSQFEVQLSQICYFANTNTLYLDISDGASELHALHNLLNHGDLYHQEEHSFRPHLTIAGLVNPLHLPAVLQQAEAGWSATSCSPRFLLSEVVCLLQEGDNWRRLWSVKLNSPSSSNNGRTAATSVTEL